MNLRPHSKPASLPFLRRRMTMNKLRNILIASLLFAVVNVLPAGAQVKFDISRGANKVTETVSGWGEQAQKCYRNS